MRAAAPTSLPATFGGKEIFLQARCKRPRPSSIFQTLPTGSTKGARSRNGDAKAAGGLVDARRRAAGGWEEPRLLLVKDKRTEQSAFCSPERCNMRFENDEKIGFDTTEHES